MRNEMRSGLLVATMLLFVPSAASAGGARFAIVLGNNQGTIGRPRLWFAEKDADRFARTLLELGGFTPDHVTVLHGADPRTLHEAFAGTEAKIRLAKRAGDTTLLVFYYSGHAAAGGLELGLERVAFAELRRLLGESEAEARIGIVDACEAGLLTQVKGATSAPGLDFALRRDDLVTGVALVTSTAVGEQAQESAAIGGSFFSFHLDAALRGAGDADGDGLVTLAEAFRYTSSMTLRGTVGTQAGAQHPTYEFHMSGRGDVVLSDLRRADAKLRFPKDPGSQYVVRGSHGIFAELSGATAPIAMAVPAGSYAIERRSDSGRATGALSVATGDDVEVPFLRPTRYELARSKGGPKPGLLYTGAGVTWVDLPGFGAAPSIAVGLRKEVGPIGLRARLEYASAHVTGTNLNYDFSLTSGTLAALYPLNVDRVLVEAGPVIGYGYASQVRADKRSFDSDLLIGGAALMVTAPVGPVRMGVDAIFAAQRFNLDQAATVRPSASGAVLVLYGF